MARVKKINYTYAIGRRKSSAARVRLYKGEGQNIVNEAPIGQYFPGVLAKGKWERAFDLTGTTGKYYVTVRVVGGGKNGQLEATVLGIARAFSKLNSEKYRVVLKKADLLTRDPRERQRRMVGTGGKARRQKQSPKR